MNRDLTLKLFKKYPKIFIGRNKPITESLIPFGIETGDGWYWLIGQLCGAIQSYCDSQNEGIRFRNEKRLREGKWNWLKDWYEFSFSTWKFWKRSFWRSLKSLAWNFKERKMEEEWQVEAMQVKEKFAGLRFYINGGDDEVDGIISFAEHLSYHICEECGKLAGDSSFRRMKHGWVFTLCEECWQKRKE